MHYDISFSQIGYGNMVQTNRILAIVGPDSAPGKRMVQDARDRLALVDASAGRKTKTILVMYSDHIILSAWDADKILASQVSPDRPNAEE